MAEESDLEKTEQPSERRLSQAREEGQVPQSRELSTFIVVVVGALMLWLLGSWMAGRMVAIVSASFRFDREHAFDTKLMLSLFREHLTDALLLLSPLFVVLIIAALASHWLLSGIVFAPQAIGFKFERMNPLKGIGRVFSVNGLVEMLKAILKSVLVGGVATLVLWSYKEQLLNLMVLPVEDGIRDFAATVALAAVLIAFGLGLLPLLDVPYQLWQFGKKMRMTKEEVKRENKEQEGDPQIKARIRAVQREMARKRMMAAVPKADVVVTNPTHFAVALKYDAARMGAPLVVAKGRGEQALKIREIAAENSVPLFEAPPLARALYAHCELDQAIPAALYTAVAEVMAYVYQLDNWLTQGGLPPQKPEQLSVPADLDPGVGTEPNV